MIMIAVVVLQGTMNHFLIDRRVHMEVGVATGTAT